MQASPVALQPIMSTWQLDAQTDWDIAAPLWRSERLPGCIARALSLFMYVMLAPGFLLALNKNGNDDGHADAENDDFRPEELAQERLQAVTHMLSRPPMTYSSQMSRGQLQKETPCLAIRCYGAA